jgi:hypothetical protein
VQSYVSPKARILTVTHQPFDAHFVKPFDHRQLLQAIESAPNL